MGADNQNVIEMKDMYKIYPNGTVANRKNKRGSLYFWKRSEF